MKERKKENKDYIFTIRLTETQKQALQVLKEKYGVTPASVITNALEGYLKLINEILDNIESKKEN